LSKPSNHGSFYIVGTGLTGLDRVWPVKVGITRGLVAARLSAIQTGNWEDLEILFKSVVRDPEKLERHIHAKFSDKRIRGEWYWDDGEIIGYSCREFGGWASTSGAWAAVRHDPDWSRAAAAFYKRNPDTMVGLDDCFFHEFTGDVEDIDECFEDALFRADQECRIDRISDYLHERRARIGKTWRRKAHERWRREMVQRHAAAFRTGRQR